MLYLLQVRYDGSRCSWAHRREVAAKLCEADTRVRRDCQVRWSTEKTYPALADHPTRWVGRWGRGGDSRRSISVSHLPFPPPCTPLLCDVMPVCLGRHVRKRRACLLEGRACGEKNGREEIRGHVRVRASGGKSLWSSISSFFFLGLRKEEGKNPAFPQSPRAILSTHQSFHTVIDRSFHAGVVLRRAII